MREWRARFLVLIAVLSIVAAACGGDDNDSGGEETGGGETTATGGTATGSTSAACNSDITVGIASASFVRPHAVPHVAYPSTIMKFVSG